MVMLDNYEPSMQPPDDLDGGRALEWDEVEPLLAQLQQELDRIYQQKAANGGDYNPLIADANGAWVFYNHAEPDLSPDVMDRDEDLQTNIYNCVRKAFIDGYMVGFKLRVSGQRYIAGG
jgi:hypothetical protein